MLIERLGRVALFGSAWVLYLMLLLSFLSIAVMIDSVIYFAKHGGDADKLGDKLIERLHADDRVGAEKVLKESNLIEAHVVRRALPWMDGGPASFSEALDAEMGRKKKDLERGMTFLGTLGNNAPFIGLFGTVLGVIQAFHQLGDGAEQGGHGQRHERHLRGAHRHRRRPGGRHPRRRRLQHGAEAHRRDRGQRRRPSASSSSRCSSTIPSSRPRRRSTPRTPRLRRPSPRPTATRSPRSPPSARPPCLPRRRDDGRHHVGRRQGPRWDRRDQHHPDGRRRPRAPRHHDGLGELHRLAEPQGRAPQGGQLGRDGGLGGGRHGRQGRRAVLQSGARRRGRPQRPSCGWPWRQNPDINLIVSGDKNATHGDVVHVIDLAKIEGITKFAINVETTN